MRATGLASGLCCLLAAGPTVAAGVGELGQIRTRPAGSSDTVLVRDGVPDFVVAVPRRWYRGLAREVVRGLLGRDDPRRIIEATVNPPLDRTHVITLGCLAENPLLFRLYWNRYSAVDLVSPGPGQARVEVVVAPYPWCAGRNVIVLGGSDETGVRKAIRHFTERLRSEGGTLSYPWELFLSSAPAPPPSVAIPEPLRFSAFNDLASRYVETTANAYAVRAFEALERLYELYRSGERRDFDYVDECVSPTTFALWDVVEHHPALTPDARLRIADLLYSVLLCGLPSHTYEWHELGTGPLLVWNHTGCPLLGIYMGARYFHGHFPETRAFTTDALKRCGNAFTTQMQVWKTREDAQHYYQLGFDTVMDYAVGEWRLDYITNGCLRQMVDFAIAVSDNMGWGSGFGDAEPLATNATELNVLDKAFAWQPDPDILWRLQHITRGQWRNRYHRGVRPRLPTRLLGIHVIPMARGIYDANQTHDGYGGTLPRSDVPFAKTFDKVSLRDGFDRMDQYLLLDGFSAGMHRHYDANMIVRFADRGRVWLMDDDYLVSHTTDHTGVSLLRARRNTMRMPVYASLEAQADTPRVGLLRTRLPAYNGADWTRDIIWHKGRFLFLRDEVGPSAAGDLLVFSVFKLLDTGQVRFTDSGSLASTQPEDSSSKPEATLTLLTATDVAAGLTRRRSNRTDIPSARLVERVAARPGHPVVFRNLLFVSDALREIDLEVRAVGEGYAAVRGQARHRKPFPSLFQGRPYQLQPAPSDRYPDTPQRVLTDGFQPGVGDIRTGWVAWYAQNPTLTLDLGREVAAPGVGVRVMGGNEWGIRFPTCVRLETAGADGRFSAAGEFRPPWPEPGHRYAERVLFPSPGGRARWIRLHFECAPGGFVFLGEVWATGGRQYSRPATESLDALVGSGRLSLPGLEIDADLAYLSPAELVFVGARACRVGGVAMDVAGKTRVAVSGHLLRAALRRAISGAFASGQRGRLRCEALPPSKLAGRYQPPEGRMVQAFPVAEGREGFVVGFGKTLCRLDAALEEVWRVDLPAPITAVGAGDLDGDGRPELLAGTADELLICFSPDGKQLWRWVVSPKVIEWAGWAEKAWVEQIRVADVNSDGQPELILGCKNSRLFVLDGERRTLWNYGLMYHGCRDIRVVDLEGTGRVQILVANRYGSVTRHDGATGRSLPGFGTEICDTFVVCAERGSEGPAVLFGGSTGKFAAYDANAKPLWRFDNEGFGALGAAMAGGRVWLASEAGLLYELNPRDGALLRTHDLGATVTHVLADGSSVLALDARGGVWRVTSEGAVTSVASTGAPALQTFLANGRLYVLTEGGLCEVER